MQNPFSLTIKNPDTGRAFRTYCLDGDDVIGVHGDEPYEIVASNATGDLVEVRISIDGIDIASGEPASLGTEGRRWVIRRHDTTAIKAWPETDESGGRFVFRQGGQSVAKHTGHDPRHLGWIAAAFFVEGAPRQFGGILRSAEARNASTMDFMMGGNEEVFRDDRSGDLGASRMRGPGTGVGSTVAQRIERVPGLRQPTYKQIVRVKYMWWDDLKAALDAHAATAAREPFVAGFPGGGVEPLGINLGSTPRITTDDPRFARSARSGPRVSTRAWATKPSST
jgi:hypothetical protein